MHERTLHTFDQNKYLLRALNKFLVEFVVIGGVAVHFHDPTRDYDDLDILINPTEENAQRTIDALKSLGNDVKFGAGHLAGPKKQIQVKHTYYADIVTPDAAFKFGRAIAAAHNATVNGVPVRVASRSDLIELKSTNRPKDQDDVRRLTCTKSR